MGSSRASVTVVTASLLVVATAGATSPPVVASAAVSSAAVSSLGARADDRVIVVMKDQPTADRPGTKANMVRSAAIASAQAPLLRQLALTHATHVTSYRLVDAFSATVSSAEAATLAASPAVGVVIPDGLIQGPARPAASPALMSAAATQPRAANGNAPPAKRDHGMTPHVIPQACANGGRPQLDPEALQTTNTASDNPAAKTARSLGITGAGVRVAFIADGLDPRNVNFIRPDGRSVFSRAFGGDYEDFSGDGPGQLTGGGEAFLDANSIAGQGIKVYDVRDFSDQPDPSRCDIRIEGVAPGAALVGLDAFGTFEFTLESNFLEAISYAVETDHVNVLNESFGSNPFPDNPALSVLDEFNDAAVAAGTTVTVSSGDSGTTNTIASPASDPQVISVGASTAFRFYAQTNFAAARYFATEGWLDDNVSAISSAGFTAAGGTVDLVAPGDLGFASCSTDILIYQDCVNLNYQASPVELSGGTSESAPLTAGAAALVIQAYRQTHEGATPSPALVKLILTSTATNLGLPASEQGSGLLNSYKAVLAAESVRTAAGAPQPAGNTLLFARTQLNAIGGAGASRSWQVRVTNTGASEQVVSAHGVAFGPDQEVRTGSVRLNDATSPQFTDYQGLPNNYAEFHFTVRPGADRLDASIAYEGVPGSDPYAPVWLTLIDPRGRLAADSIPQGTGDYGNVDVRAPVAGKWTGVIFGITAADSGTNGTVHWRIATERFTSFGQVSPAAFALAPGQSQTLRVTERLPGQAGEAAGSIVLRSDQGGADPYLGQETESIPVTLRALVGLARGGTFGGVLTGGNGRWPGIGQADYFEFHVGPGHRGIEANVTLTRDAADMVGSYLIAPDGQALGFGQNALNGVNTRSLTAYALDPAPGDWTLAVDFTGPVVGDSISQPFHGSIRLDDAKATAPSLPDSRSTLLRPRVPETVEVKVTNTGAAPEAYFVDARLAKLDTITLEPQAGSTFLLPIADVQPQWFVPSWTVSLTVTAKATVPIDFDWGPSQGDPDLFDATGARNRATTSFTPTAGPVQPGNWIAGPDQIGPYPHGAQVGSVTMSMTARTQPFDPAMTASTGDLWLQSIYLFTPFGPLVVPPGKSGVIKVTIRPRGVPGTVVRGDLYVDDFVSSIPPYDQTAADELVAIPYAYTIR
jgi:hypothetical protein